MRTSLGTGPAPLAWLALLWCVWIAPAVNHATAQEVVAYRWGFDGRTVPERFNRLSIQFLNPHSENVRTKVSVRPTGFSGDVGGAVQQDLFLAPGQRRWLDFVVFVQRDIQGAKATWKDPSLGRRRSEFLGIQPVPESFGFGSWSPGSTVDLRDPKDPLRRGIPKLPTLDPARFPTNLLATDGLVRIVLDAPPRLDAVRAQVFQDWFRKGGEVVLLNTVDGPWPTTGALSMLAEDAPPELRGAGRVIRAKRTRAKVKDARAAGLIAMYGVQHNNSPGSFTQALHTEFRERVRPDHQWGGILLLGLLFLAFVGPGHYLISKRVHYLASLGILGGAIALWTYGFLLMGARGYGEESRLQAVAHIQPFSAERVLATQWGSVFATDSDVYRLQLPSETGVWSTGSVSGQVPAVSTAGPRAAMSAEIPLFSSRSVVHEGVYELSMGWPCTKGGERGSVRFGPGIRQEDVLAAWYYDNASLRPLRPAGDGSWSAPKGRDEERFSVEGLGDDGRRSNALRIYPGGRGVYPSRDVGVRMTVAIDGTQTMRTDLPSELLSRLRTRHPDDAAFPALIARALQLDLTAPTKDHRALVRASQPRVFLWVDLPEELRLENPRLGTAQGRALVELPVLDQ